MKGGGIENPAFETPDPVLGRQRYTGPARAGLGIISDQQRNASLGSTFLHSCGLLVVGVGQDLGGTMRWPRMKEEKIQGSPWPSSSRYHTLSLQDNAEVAKPAEIPFSTYLFG
ncbi:hypothetical protein DUI87_05000 [Hirundo rustica rustica]|uniref:Uncharacterized protein n=1 Tax=Hirundo rustica rustica TaxID=333673 RepID=A0A3M0KZK4_HIRRU|nr:hypothetical protein DUI87_05000 [Hirundo rustica rustica]